MKILCCSLWILLVSACAAAESPAPNPQALANARGYQLNKEVKSINNYDVSGWQYVSNRAIIIPASPGHHYLLLLDRNCTSLRGREVIGFTTTVGRVLSRFDAVVAGDKLTGMHQRCIIQRMYSLTKIKPHNSLKKHAGQ